MGVAADVCRQVGCVFVAQPGEQLLGDLVGDPVGHQQHQQDLCGDLHLPARRPGLGQPVPGPVAVELCRQLHRRAPR